MRLSGVAARVDVALVQLRCSVATEVTMSANPEALRARGVLFVPLDGKIGRISKVNVGLLSPVKQSSTPRTRRLALPRTP